MLTTEAKIAATPDEKGGGMDGMECKLSLMSAEHKNPCHTFNHRYAMNTKYSSVGKGPEAASRRSGVIVSALCKGAAARVGCLSPSGTGLSFHPIRGDPPVSIVLVTCGYRSASVS